MRITEIMARPVITVKADTSLEEVARLLLDNDIGGVPVVDDDGKLLGMISESDFAARNRGVPFSTFRCPQVFGQWMPKEGIEKLYEAARSMKASEIMSPDLATVPETASLEEVIQLMLDRDVRRVPVVRDNKPVGIVTRRDLLRVMLLDRRSANAARPA